MVQMLRMSPTSKAKPRKGHGLCGRIAIASDTAHALQVPEQWWVPTWRKDSNYSTEMSLKEVIQLQLEASTDTILLPKYLLVVYQLSM